MDRKSWFVLLLVFATILLAGALGTEAVLADPLAAPQGFCVSAEDGGDSFRFSWNAVSGADSYIVEYYQPYVDQWAEAVKTDKTTAEYKPENDMAALTLYRVVACSGSSRGTDSAVIMAGNAGCLTSVGLQSNVEGIHLVLLKDKSGWAEQEYTTLHYCIMREDESTGKTEEVARLDATGLQYPFVNPLTGKMMEGFFGMYYCDSSAQPGHTFRYFIQYRYGWKGSYKGQAVQPFILKADRNSSSLSYPKLMPAPGNLTVTKSDLDITAFRWKFDAVPEAERYKFYLVELDDFLYLPFYVTEYDYLEETSHVEAYGREVLFVTWVVAIGTDGENYSIPSDYVYFGYVNPCTDLNARQDGAGVRLEWSNPTSLAGYRFGVYRTDGSGKAERIAETTGTNFTDTMVEAGKRYEYYVVTEIVRKGTAVRTGTEVDTVIRSAEGNHAAAEPAGETTQAKIEVEAANGRYRLSGSKAVFTGPVDKNLTSLTILDKIDIDGKTYKVTEISSSACKGMKKLKKLTIGKNVRKIGKNAFYGCKKLKNITIRTKKLIDSGVGANAFKKINRKATFKCPKGKSEAYEQILLKKGAGTTCRFK